MKRIVRVAVSLVGWIAGGLALTSWALRLPIDMPDFLHYGVKGALGWIWRIDLADTDDMEETAFAVILAASFVVSALVVAATNLMLTRTFAGRTARL